MKILIIHPNLTERGGAERKILLLTQHLKKNDHNVKILCFRYNKENCFNELICDDDVLYCDITKFWFIVHFLICIFLHRKFSRLVISNYPAHLFGIFIKLLMPKKKMIWICNEINSLLHRKIRYKHRLIMYAEKKFIHKFDLIIANSQNTREKIKQYFGMNSTVVYPGLNLQKSSVSDKMHGEDYYLCITRLTQGKNIEFLEEVLKVSPRKVILAGDGELKSFTERLAQKYNNLELQGSVSDEKKFELYRNAVAMLFLPLDEPFGVTNIEAINEGCPVIAFNQGGPKEIIIHNKNGYLCNDSKQYLQTVSNFEHLEKTPEFFGEMMHKNFGLGSMLRGLSSSLINVDEMKSKS